MKTIALVLLCTATSLLNAESLSGCKPALEAAIALRETAQKNGDDAAVQQWQDIRDFQSMPVWHEIPLEQLMQTSLIPMSDEDIRSFVLTGCSAQFDLFAQEAASKINEILSTKPTAQ